MISLFRCVRALGAEPDLVETRPEVDEQGDPRDVAESEDTAEPEARRERGHQHHADDESGHNDLSLRMREEEERYYEVSGDQQDQPGLPG